MNLTNQEWLNLTADVNSSATTKVCNKHRFQKTNCIIFQCVRKQLPANKNLDWH
jgi:hypothetical protein